MKSFKENLDRDLQELFERIMSQSSQEPANFQKKAEQAIEVIKQNIEAEARKQLAITLAKEQSKQGRVDIDKMIAQKQEDDGLDR